MKKTLTMVMAALSIMGATAADQIIYNDGQLAGGVKPYEWYNSAFAFDTENPDGEGKVFSFKYAANNPNASMGLFATGETFLTGTLHSANLQFSWYAKATGKCTVRLTADGGVEQNYTWEITEADINKWNEVSVSVATTFPTVAEQWNNFIGKGAGYVFGLVLENTNTENTIYFSNIRYTDIDEAWEKPYTPEIVPPTTVPAIAKPADEVLSMFSKYGIANFGIGGWGQSTRNENVEINGVTVMKLVNFNYIGWELNPTLDASGYTHMHVDFYPCENTNFGFTPISPGPQEKTWLASEVKVNEWNSYDVPLSYFANVDLSNIFQTKFCEGNTGAECYLANVYFWKEEGGEDPDPVTPVEPGATFAGTVSNTVDQTVEGEVKTYPYTLDYSIVYNADKTLTITANYVFTEGEPFGVVPGTLFINGAGQDFAIEAGKRRLVTTATYEANQVLELRFYIPGGAGAILQDTISYKVGESNISTAVAEIEAAATAEYYTLQGVRVQNPEKGLYIKVANGKAQKVIF